MVAIVIILVAVGLLATALLSRLGREGRTSDAATLGLARLGEALEAYAATAGRLPCPANPGLASTDAAWGDEAVASPNIGVCQFPAGTVPWRTVGARAEDALDPWGMKISYRVFSGTSGVAGSLTQPGGATMVECDTFDPSPGNATGLVLVQGGLCVSNTNPNLRSTRESVFLANKGLSLTDMGVARNPADVAYVLLSHGPTGRGGYTSSGNPTTAPTAGDELNNTNPTGPFTIRAASAAGTDPSDAAHFDDRLFYRTLADLLRRANLAARNWPEALPAGSTTATFDQETVGAAVGSPVSPGASVGSVTVTFTGIVATGSGEITFDNTGGFPGIGVAGGGSALIQSPLIESVSFQFSTSNNRKFAITLGDFGTYGGGRYEETAVFAFLQSGTLIDFKVGQGCRTDGGLASFQMDVPVDFDQVVVLSYYARDTTDMSYDVADISAFLISDIAACPASPTACVTSLTDFGNICSVL